MRIFAAIAFVLLTAGSVALADQLIGAGSGYFSTQGSFTVDGGLMGETGDGGTSAPSMFRASGKTDYYVTRVASAGEGWCGFGLVTNQILGQGVWMSSPSGAGGGDIHYFPAAGEYLAHPSFMELRKSAAIGICDNTVTKGGESVYEPCRSASDCSNDGGCRIDGGPTAEQLENVASYLYCASQTGTVRMGAMKQKVRR
jgi:hypothetical protein